MSVFSIAKNSAELPNLDLKEEILAAIEDRWTMLSLQLDQIEKGSRMFEERLKITARIAELEYLRSYIESRQKI